MKIKDWEVLSICSLGIAFLGLILSASFAVFGGILAPCFIIGSIILLLRRGILKVKRKLEKKQAV
jgi:hypothetical protein